MMWEMTPPIFSVLTPFFRVFQSFPVVGRLTVDIVWDQSILINFFSSGIQYQLLLPSDSNKQASVKHRNGGEKEIEENWIAFSFTNCVSPKLGFPEFRRTKRDAIQTNEHSFSYLRLKGDIHLCWEDSFVTTTHNQYY